MIYHPSVKAESQPLEMCHSASPSALPRETQAQSQGQKQEGKETG